MIRKFAIVVLALSMSAASANAMAPMKSHDMKHLHMMAMCADGQVTAPCACASNAAGLPMSKHQMCKVGHWCHTMTAHPVAVRGGLAIKVLQGASPSWLPSLFSQTSFFIPRISLS